MQSAYRPPFAITIAMLALLLAAPGPGRAAGDPQLAALLGGGAVAVVAGETVDAATLRAAYGPDPILRWTDPVRAAAALAALEGAASHGLEPRVYHVDAIVARQGRGDPAARAEVDLLLSDGVARLAVDLRAGAVDPRRVSPELAIARRDVDPVAVLTALLAAPEPQRAVEALAPRHAAYEHLRVVLAGLRAQRDRGGWPTVPDGPTVKPGASDAAIPLVRRRLAATGELPPGASVDDPRYDEVLVGAVEAFQRRHGLAPDGAIGRATRAALATTVDQRIAQVVANLERWRWMPDDLGARHLRVNVPDFRLELVEDGARTLEMPVVVGRADRRTPLLSTRITRLVFNPTWTVPVKLARHDMLPRVRRDETYFANHGIRVYAGWRSDAEELDPSTIDWHEVGGGMAALKLRQEPGPGNPLGRVKFDMPNGFDVYLHDTNAKGLMRVARRALSSGCVRVGDAQALVDALLRRDATWTADARAAWLAGWQTRVRSLPDPVAVHLTYETAWRDEAGIEQFREDIYGWDAGLARAVGRRAGPQREA